MNVSARGEERPIRSWEVRLKLQTECILQNTDAPDDPQSVFVGDSALFQLVDAVVKRRYSTRCCEVHEGGQGGGTQFRSTAQRNYSFAEQFECDEPGCFHRYIRLIQSRC